MPACVRLLSFAWIVLFVFGSTETSAQSLGGVVIDPAGSPVRGAVVRVLEHGIERDRIETDDNGAFAIESACPGCQIEVSKIGFATVTSRLNQSGTAEVTLPLAVSESVVVTATGRDARESDVGAAITVLDSSQIEPRQALSTTDLLRTVPGVIAARSGGVGTLTSLWVRGGESTYNKVLLDGVPLNEPGGTFNFALIAPENIERIEVLRGAHSALFGSDAMASVIQIFSVRPANQGRPEFDITADGGNYSTGRIAGGAGGRNGRVDYRGFGSHLSTDNREPNNAHDSTSWSGSAGIGLESGGSLRFLLRTDHATTGTPGQTAFGRPDMDAHFDHREWMLHSGWDQPTGARLLQRAAYSFASTRQRSTNLIADPPYIPAYNGQVSLFGQFFDFLYDSGTELKRHHFDYRADYRLAAGQTLTAAFAYDGERGVLTDFMSGADPQRPARDNTGTSVQYENLTGPFSFVSGIRFEQNGSFGFYAAPRASLSWLVSNTGLAATRLHASAGLGIKEPTFIQSYSPSPGFRGNPDLDPERSRGYDLGMEQRFARNRVRVDLTYFSNEFDDLVSLQTTNPATFESQYFNIGKSRAGGLELTGDAFIGRAFQLRGYYVYLDSKVVKSTSSSPIFQAGNELYRRPRHSASIQGNLTFGRGSAGLGMIFVGERVDTDSSGLGMTSNESYTLLNATGEVRLARRTSFYVTLENLANADYMDPLGYIGLGRTARFGLRTRF